MMATKSEIEILLKATDQASAKLKQVEGSVNRLTKESGGLKKAWTALQAQSPLIGHAMSLILNPITLASAGIAAFGKIAIDSVGKASDLNETISKTNVIFGDAADVIVEKSSQVAASLGQSQQSFLDATSSFGVFGKSAGLTGEELAKFSMDLTGLASDMASFSNTSPEEAILAIGAALRGESEPIRRYGVLLDDASLRQKALEMGIIDTVKNALTPQQRVLAAQALIFQQTADAQGDFARTSDGLANQQRILKAEVDNLKTSLGNALLPAAIAVTSALVDVAEAMSKVTAASQKSEDAAEDFADVLEEYNEMVEAGVIETDNATESTTNFGRAHGKARSSTLEMKDAIEEAKTAMIDEGLAAEEAYGAVSEADLAGRLMAAGITGEIIPAEEALKDATEEAAEAQRLMNEKMSNLNDLINGKLGPEIDEYNGKQQAIQTEMQNIRGEIDTLISQGYSPMGRTILELEGKYEELKGQYGENATEHEAATKRILFDLLSQRAAVDGLSDAEFQVLTGIATRWGLVDEATGLAGDAISGVLEYLAHGGTVEVALDKVDAIGTHATTAGDNFALAMEAAANSPGMAAMQAETDDLYTKVMGVGGTHGIQFKVSVTCDPIPNIGKGAGGGNGENYYAKGADFIIPPGYPNDTYPIGYGTSGERVIVVPKSEQRNTNNYTLNVHTNAQTNNLTRDFGIMRAMAG